MSIVCSPATFKTICASLFQAASFPKSRSAACDGVGSTTGKPPREATANPRLAAKAADAVRRFHDESFEQLALALSGTDTDKGAPAPSALVMFSGGI